MVNSRPGHVTATSPSSPREAVHQERRPFSRSYGAILPSSLTGFHSSTLGYSPHPPVSVYGTVSKKTRLEVFLGSLIRASLRPLRDSPSCLGVMTVRICLDGPPTQLDPHFRSRDGLSLLRHPIAQTSPHWYGNINPFPITYASRPRLRGRLTLSGLTFLRKPWVYGEQVFHLFYRYSCRHNLFRYVHHSLQSSFIRIRNAPLPPLRARSFGAGLESRSLSAQNH